MSDTVLFFKVFGMLEYFLKSLVSQYRLMFFIYQPGKAQDVKGNKVGDTVILTRKVQNKLQEKVVGNVRYYLRYQPT